jgi:beta-glucosidase
LPVSWPRAVGQEPLYYDALSTGRPADGVDLTHPPTNSAEKYHSRYIDEQNSPQFPFGYGLAYTTFKFGLTQASESRLSLSKLKSALHSAGDKANVLSVSAGVTNTGSRPGEETVQLYVRLQGTSIALPVRMLKGFQRISLKPGETRKVTFEVPADAFAFWNAANTYGVEPAKVTLWVAPNSAEGESATVQISGAKN